MRGCFQFGLLAVVLAILERPGAGTVVTLNIKERHSLLEPSHLEFHTIFQFGIQQLKFPLIFFHCLRGVFNNCHVCTAQHPSK
ncbi:hypothetical protein Y032_0144g2455 [Ancylostoma ceylanicum]|nr:hypothetical protein Y032_0144g2455 [Ancylostoma ceylanicum]